MARICVGDRVEAKLMGYAQPIIGRVGTAMRAHRRIQCRDGCAGRPSVDPICTWVRLAQRVPVRPAEIAPGLTPGMNDSQRLR